MVVLLALGVPIVSSMQVAAPSQHSRGRINRGIHQGNTSSTSAHTQATCMDLAGTYDGRDTIFTKVDTILLTQSGCQGSVSLYSDGSWLPVGDYTVSGNSMIWNSNPYSISGSTGAYTMTSSDGQIVISPQAQSDGANATGDPHLQNVRGERFDVMEEGSHVLITIPRGMSAENALLRVMAGARRQGGHCADIYFQQINITGSWAEAKHVGGYHYSVSHGFTKTTQWATFGKVDLKVVHGRTESGIRYLNLYAKHLGRAGFDVGGLLGVDDHSDVNTLPAACSKYMSMKIMKAGKSPHFPLSVASVAMATSA